MSTEKPIQSTMKADADKVAHELVRKHWQLTLNLKALHHAGVQIPTYWDNGARFGVYDTQGRDHLLERDRNAILGQYIKNGAHAGPEPIAAEKFEAQCEWCGWAAPKGEKCSRPGCKGFAS